MEPLSIQSVMQWLAQHDLSHYDPEDQRHLLRQVILKTYDPIQQKSLADWSLYLFHLMYGSPNEPAFTPLVSLFDRVGGWFYGGTFLSMSEWMNFYRGHINDIKV